MKIAVRPIVKLPYEIAAEGKVMLEWIPLHVTEDELPSVFENEDGGSIGLTTVFYGMNTPSGVVLRIVTLDDDGEVIDVTPLHLFGNTHIVQTNEGGKDCYILYSEDQFSQKSMREILKNKDYTNKENINENGISWVDIDDNDEEEPEGDEAGEDDTQPEEPEVETAEEETEPEYAEGSINDGEPVQEQDGAREVSPERIAEIRERVAQIREENEKRDSTKLSEERERLRKMFENSEQMLDEEEPEEESAEPEVETVEAEEEPEQDEQGPVIDAEPVQEEDPEPEPEEKEFAPEFDEEPERTEESQLEKLKRQQARMAGKPNKHYIGVPNDKRDRKRDDRKDKHTEPARYGKNNNRRRETEKVDFGSIAGKINLGMKA